MKISLVYSGRKEFIQANTLQDVHNYLGFPCEFKINGRYYHPKRQNQLKECACFGCMFSSIGSDIDKHNCLLTLHENTGNNNNNNLAKNTLHRQKENSARNHNTLDHLIQIHVLLPLLGGKGGFGSMLRAQGGRMSKKSKNENTDACRDLQGRRIQTVKEAQKIAEYISREPERKRQKIERLEEKIEKAQNPKTQKILFDDREFLENHEKAVSSVKSTLELALARKKQQKRAVNGQKLEEEKDLSLLSNKKKKSTAQTTISWEDSSSEAEESENEEESKVVLSSSSSKVKGVKA